MTSRPSTAAPVLAAIVLVAALVGAYVAGYLWLGQLTTANQGIAVLNGVHYRAAPRWCRNFNTQWEAVLFEPATKVESWLRGIEIEATSSAE
jgi:hypothetical protein